MVGFEEAGRMLDEAAEALPQEIFEGLNGGVNLLPARKTDQNGLLVMGTYNVNQMGRYVEIYYGSFRAAHGQAGPDKWRRELTRTLKHELTHHIESLAGDRSLEKWDERHVAELLAGLCEPLEAESVLFVDADGGGLAPLAAGLFRQALRAEGADIPCASAGALGAAERVNPRAVRAAELYGADISGSTPREATEELLGSYDAVLCMTEAQADALAGRFPAFDERILCLGEEDIAPPLIDTQGGWNRAAGRLAPEIEYLLDELLGTEDGGHEDT